jgi:hypothetical protein
MSPRKGTDVKEPSEGAWFWKRLDQATEDYEALPRWMKRETDTSPKKRAAKSARPPAKRAA